MVTTAKIPIAPALLMRPNLTFKEKSKKCKHGMKYLKLSSLTLTKHLCHTSASKTALMQRKDPLTFHWLERERKKIMGTFTITMSGSFLPMHLIYKRRTSCCFPKGVDFPADFDVTCTTNHRRNESKPFQHLEKIVFPYVKKKKRKQNWIFLWIKRQ